MPLEQIKCPICGNTETVERIDTEQEPTWRCACCYSVFVEKLAKREYEKLESAIREHMEAGVGRIESVIDEALLREKTKEFTNLRAELMRKVNANYTDSKAIVKICEKILLIAPGDFLAEFFHIANSGTRVEIAAYINGINEEENAVYMETVIDFIIRSLKEEYITPTAALLERCAKIFTPRKKQEYFTKYEEEAGKVKEGIYEVGLNRDVFLAYSGKDMQAVRELLDFIESDEIGLTCFAAFRNLQHGRDAVADYDRALKEAMNNCSIFLFVSSVNSRSFSCDALKKEIAYIRNYDMANNPGYISYDQIPMANRKLRIEYRLDNKPTLADKNISQFFSGLTYVEDYEQLRARLCECMDSICGVPTVKEEEKHTYTEDDFERRVNEEIARREEENAKRRAEEEARLRATVEAQIRAEAEKRIAAENERERKGEEEARVKVSRDTYLETESALDAEDDVTSIDTDEFDDGDFDDGDFDEDDLALSVYPDFKIQGNVLKKYIGKETEVVIPTIVKTIGSSSFANCEGLEYVFIPFGVEAIGEYAFYDCDSLVSVEIPTSVKTVGAGAFAASPNLKIYVSPGTDISAWGKNWNGGCAVYEIGTNKRLIKAGLLRKS